MTVKSYSLVEICEVIKDILINKLEGTILINEDIDYDDDLFIAVRGFSSIDALELLVLVEEFFSIGISDDEGLGLESLQNISSIASYVYKIQTLNNTEM